jgi:hypothetical protein
VGAARKGGVTSHRHRASLFPAQSEAELYSIDWCAMYEGGRVLQISPAGKVLQEIRVPALCPTMPCLGGDDLKTLYLTTAREKRPGEEPERFPESGCVFSMRVEVAGLPVDSFVEQQETVLATTVAKQSETPYGSAGVRLLVILFRQPRTGLRTGRWTRSWPHRDGARHPAASPSCRSPKRPGSWWR